MEDEASDAADQPDKAPSERKLFPVVGVGASAGGLEALEQFISGLPEKNGIAFVIVIHTHPDHPTRLPELLRRKSSVKVVLIQDAMTVETDTVYVPPSDRDTIIEDGVLRLQERPRRSHIHMPIDIFLRSLAGERGDRAGCIILSGTGTDGTGGLRLIKENAGVAVAQAQKSARHTGMPASAIDTGMVDYVLTPQEMADQLIAYFRHPAALKTGRQESGKPPEQLSEILSFLADHTDHDFSLYKKNTVVRRIERRMMVNQCGSMADYLAFLQKNPDETHRLFQDLLIGVTNFFRDPEVFDFMEKEVLPELLSQGGNNENIRVWVAGCSTGEEAYSVAIIILETMEKLGIKRFLQIFATDIDADAINKARQGVYPKNIAVDVSKTRLDTFFTEEKNHYRINKDIRELIVFAEQNVLRDPPFMHLEMLVCRNLLIYLEPAAQKKLDDSFHSAKRFAEAIVDTVRESLVVLDTDKQVEMANRRFYETFQTSREKTEGRYFFDLENGRWDIPELRRRLEDITRHDRAFQDFEIANHSEKTGDTLLRLNARRLRDADPDQDRILLAIETMSASETQQPPDKKG